MRRIAVYVMAGAVVLAGCGTKPKTEQPSSAGPTLSPTTPVPGAGGAPPAPTSTLANKPGCAESTVFGIAILGVGTASPEQRAQFSTALDTAAAKFKAAVPTLADSIDTQVAVAKRAADGKGEPGDTDKVKAAAEPYQKWFNDTCTKA